MALFLLRSSYRMLMAVCLLLGVNVSTFYVLNQGGGHSLGETTAYLCFSASIAHIDTK